MKSKKYVKYIFILIIIIELSIILVCMTKYIKLSNAIPEFKKRIEELRRNGNYYCTYSLLNDNIEEKYEEYNKDGKYFSIYVYNDSDKKENKVIYCDGRFTYNIDELNKKFEKNENNYNVIKSDANKEGFSEVFDYVKYHYYENLKSEITEFNGKKCYVIYTETGDSDIYLDYNTYDIIGIKNYRGKNYGEPDYYEVEFKINMVKDDDIKGPDITGYEEIEVIY